MIKTSLFRLGTATFVTGVATLALSAPANAVRVPDPQGSVHQATHSVTTRTPAPDSSGADWQHLALGASGGLALAGVGVGAAAVAVARRRNRSSQALHPA